MSEATERRLWPAWAAAASFLCLACEQAPGGTSPGTCATSADCGSAAVCDRGVCTTTCNLDDDCPAKDMACELGLCRQVFDAECSKDSDCATTAPCVYPASAACAAGRCSAGPLPAGTACLTTNPCAVGGVCDGDGGCVDTYRRCDDPPDNECINGDNTFVTYPSLGVCDPSDGSCHYEALELTCIGCTLNCLVPCLSVACDDLRGGCYRDGRCLGGQPAECSYLSAADGTPCDRAGSAFGAADGFCNDSQCAECQSGADCPPSPVGLADCFDPSCVDRLCIYTPRAEQICQPGGCTDGFIYADRLCGDGTCPEPIPAGTSCLGYACESSTTCQTSCTGPADCVTGACLDGNVCETPRPLGAPCGVDGECQSGFCADGVCCAEACDGPCEMCSGAGQCDLVPAEDSACGSAGVIDCDGLDTICRDFTDLTTSQCASVGVCKQANSADCGDGTPINQGGECGARACDSLVLEMMTCDGGECTGSTVVESCDDSNPCTNDLCTTAGCTHTAVDNGTECGSRSCVSGVWTRQSCQGGVCNGSATVENCNDANPCTSDTCSASLGCAHPTGPADGAECGSRYCDGLVWTRGSCSGGTCGGSAVLQNCDDGNVCTSDTCSASGCNWGENAADCGNCGSCSGGACTANNARCTGNCDVCNGSFTCVADQSACATCSDCTGSANSYSCTALTSGTDSGCDAPSACVSGACLLGDTQVTCDSSGDCQSGFCDLSVGGPETGRCCAPSGIQGNTGECCDANADCGGSTTRCIEQLGVCTTGNSAGSGTWPSGSARCYSFSDCRNNCPECFPGEPGFASCMLDEGSGTTCSNPTSQACYCGCMC